MASTRFFTLIIIVLLCSVFLYMTHNQYSISFGHLMLHKSWHKRGNINYLTAEPGIEPPPSTVPQLNRHCSRGHEDCHGHVQLCWLRDVLSHGYNQTFSKDMYDLSPLYTFKTHMFLVSPQFFEMGTVGGNILVKTGKILLQAMKRERLLTGSKLEPHDLPKFRKCDYNPDNEYQYRINAYLRKESIHVYVDEILLTKNQSWRINDIFGVITTNRTIGACQLVDYFNNHTYHIVCPVLENRFQISIRVMYHSISPLLFQCKNSNFKQLRLYTNADFKHTRNALKPGIPLTKSAEARCTDSKGHNKGFWLKGVPGVPQSVFHWATATCHYSFIISNNSLSCLRRKKILMLGDSHMRRRAWSIKHTYELPNFECNVPTTHSIHLLHNLLVIYEAFLNGSKYVDLLVINAGAHDLLFLDIIMYIAHMSDIFTMFKRFLDLPKPPKIMWLEIYPTPYNGAHRRYMTNLVAKGTNDWVNHNMKKLGIEVVHSFDIGTTMESHDKDGIHYWDSFGPNMIPPGGKTSVGGAVISVLFNMICPNATIKTYPKQNSLT